ncbi:MAG: lamin tail domain-containing protein, partial [Sedimentisphaerales bacterium]|nr:lamin tail domain-containing protein [Sedimentisphaerales bacterium]
MRASVGCIVQLLLLCSPSLGQIAGQNLVINEFMAANNTSIQDSLGDYDDWIEIYNAGETAVDLAGYYLTDDPSEPTK